MKGMEGCSRSFCDRLNENLQNEKKKYRLLIAIDYVDFLSIFMSVYVSMPLHLSST